MAIFTIRQDLWALVVGLVFVVFVVPFIASEHVIAGYLTPFLIWVIASIGLNILLGLKDFILRLPHWPPSSM